MIEAWCARWSMVVASTCGAAEKAAGFLLESEYPTAPPAGALGETDGAALLQRDSALHLHTSHKR